VYQVDPRQPVGAPPRQPPLDHRHWHDEAEQPEPDHRGQEAEDAQEGKQEHRGHEHGDTGRYGGPEPPYLDPLFGDDGRGDRIGRARRAGPERQRHRQLQRVRHLRDRHAGHRRSETEQKRRPEPVPVEVDRLGDELPDRPLRRRQRRGQWLCLARAFSGHRATVSARRLFSPCRPGRRRDRPRRPRGASLRREEPAG
jgi:hypothetical protein